VTTRGRRLVVAGAAALLALPPAVGVGASTPATAAVEPDEDPAALSIDGLPSHVGPGDQLDVSGTVANSTADQLRDVEVRLRVSDTRLGSRTELAAVVRGETSSRDGAVVATASLPDLAAGDSTPFTLSEAVAEIPALTEYGVYVLGVEVLASRDSGFGRVTIVRTGLPWTGEPDSFEPTGFSWLWPLVSRPVRLADGTFADDTLAREMAPEGRLTRLVAAGAALAQGAELTWVVDPALLDAAEDMADQDGYRVRAGDGTTVEGAGGDLAVRWLQQLRVATGGRPTLALPYGDVDVVSLDRNGLLTDLARAQDEARVTLTRVLPAAAAVTETAWPMDGYAPRRTLGALRRSGVRTVVLDGRAVPPEIELNYTPSGRADVTTPAGRLTGVLADPVLSDLLRTRGPDPRLGAQRVLAEMAMVTAELPGTGPSRRLVLAPPRRWDPDPVFLDHLAGAGADAPWTAPVPLGDVAAAEPPEVDRQPVRYPRRLRRLELPGTYLSALRGMRTSISVFSTVLTDTTEYVPELNRSVLLLESTWWRSRQARVNRMARERAYLAELRDAVRIQPGNFTFSSRTGRIPLTVANELTQDVRVLIRLRPQTPRLRIGDLRTQVIGAQTKVQIEVPATAVAGGPVVVDASLRTVNGTAYGQPVQLRINITQYGTVALYITVVAAAVLFVAAGFRVVRRVLAARRESTPAPAEDAHPVPEHTS
jgi:hypothetical protein